MGQGGVDGDEVALHDGVAALAIGLFHRGLDPSHGLVGRQYLGQGEEARLHHRVDPVAEFGLSRHPVAVDDPQLDVLVLYLALHVTG